MLAETEVSSEHLTGEGSVSKLECLSVEFSSLMAVGLRATLSFFFTLDSQHGGSLEVKKASLLARRQEQYFVRVFCYLIRIGQPLNLAILYWLEASHERRVLYKAMNIRRLRYWGPLLEKTYGKYYSFFSSS